MSLLTDALTKPGPKTDDTAESAITELEDELEIGADLDQASRDPTVQTMALDELMLDEFEAARRERDAAEAAAPPPEDPEPDPALDLSETDVLSEEEVLAAQSIVLEALPEDAEADHHQTLEILHEPPTLTDADIEREPTMVVMPEPGATTDKPRRSPFKLIIAAMMVLLVAVAAGAYFWMQPSDEFVAGSLPQTEQMSNPAPTQLSSLPVTTVVESSNPDTAPETENVEPTGIQTASLTPPSFEREPATKADVLGFAAAAERTTELEQVGQPTIEIATTRTQSPVYLALKGAYAQFQQGRFDKAERLYQQVLELDPNSVDALLGVAAIAQRANNATVAQNYYRMALSIDPRNSIAVAGLMSLKESFAKVENESELKSMLAQQPHAAHLHFALGLHYVSQSRWPDAQQSFFQAVRYDPANADYAFNLAVSLDQLGQRDTAATYYRRAIELASGVQKFDPDAARNRLETLTAGG